MEENNYYKDKGKRKFLDLSGLKEKNKNKNKMLEDKEPETGKDKLNKTLKGVGKDLAVGVLAGGLGAALFGRYSFLAGLVISGYGHYAENTALTTFGLGMMSSSSMTAAKGVNQNPNATIVEKMQERVKAFGEELQRKLFLDKLMTTKDEKPELKGIEKTDKTPKAEYFKGIDKQDEYKDNIMNTIQDQKATDQGLLNPKKDSGQNNKPPYPPFELDLENHLY